MTDQDPRTRVHSLVKQVTFLPQSDMKDDLRLVQDLEIDSLDRVELCMAVEEEFGIDIPDEAVEAWQTVGDVFATVAA
ncbi:MAG: acyl carrier protein [Pseudomonadota bacterium]